MDSHHKTAIVSAKHKHRNADVEQAIIRLTICLLTIAYCLYAALTGRTTATWVEMLILGGTFLIAALIILAKVWTHGSIPARLAGMVMDIGMLSYVIGMLQEPGFVLLPIYLWVIVGNGLRFGFRYLLVAMGLSMFGFVLVFTAEHIWNRSPYMAAGWLLALLVLPIYFGVLLRRTQMQSSEIERMSQHLEMLAKHDTLTAIPNRSAFYERVKDEMVRADSGGHSFAMAFVDLDGFKAVNDDYGHDIGDKVIKTAAERITDSVRTDDFVARLGGDEFVILLPCHNAEWVNVNKAAKRILAALAAPFDAGGRAITLSASIGVAFYPRDGSDLESLLRRADGEMYNVKRAGKNGYRITAG